MRIIFIENEDINRNSSGGVMSYLLNLSKHLRENGIKTVLIGSGKVNLEKVNNTFSHFFSITEDSTISNFKFFMKLFASNELKHIDKGDIIHVQRAEMVIPLFLRKRNKIICTLHGGQDLSVLKKKGRTVALFYSILQFISFALVDQLIVVDKKNLVRYIKKYPWIKRKINHIPISVDTNKFFPKDKRKSREKFNFQSNEKILLFIGRLEYEKNVEFIIDNFKCVKNKNYKLVIVGSGSLSDKLKLKASNHKDKIIFFGEINNSLITNLINASDALVLTSFFEGSPTVIKEALCCEVPIISTDVGDVKETLELVNGGEIIDFTTKSFLKALHKVFSKKWKFTKDISILFNLKVMGEKTRLIYQIKL